MHDRHEADTPAEEESAEVDPLEQRLAHAGSSHLDHPRSCRRDRRRSRSSSSTRSPRSPTSATSRPNAAILLVIAVGMTFVIITAGIDLSVGSVLVFSGVVAAKVMNGMGGEGWGVISSASLVAVGCRPRLGRAQRPAHHQGAGAAADRHARHARHGARPGPAHHRRHRRPRGAAEAVDVDRRRPARRPGPVAGGHRGRGGRARLRPRARAHPLRPPHLRDRLQRRGGAPRRHQRRPAPDRGLRPLGRAGRPGRDSCASPASPPPRSAGTPPTTCRRSPPSSSAAPACSAASARCSARSSACSSPPCCRTAS